MGNRIDRFEWERGQLEFDRNIIKFRAFQQDAPENAFRGNHDGGVIRFGPDGKLYAIVGDTGRRGQMQNLATGPFTPPAGDDQFGGPEPDDLHRTGVIVRLDEDGDAPRDNPFWRVGRHDGRRGRRERPEDLLVRHPQQLRHGLRPEVGGRLWQQENGDDSFSELNRVSAGMNSGWIQIMGPASRVAQFKAIETTMGPISDPRAPNGYFGLQQTRWLPTNIADTPEQALARLFVLPGSFFSDPELSWKFEVGPGGIGFLDSNGPRARVRGRPVHGRLAQLPRGRAPVPLQPDAEPARRRRRRPAAGGRRRRQRRQVGDHRERDACCSAATSASGPTSSTGPDGDLYVVSNSLGSVLEIYKRKHR